MGIESHIKPRIVFFGELLPKKYRKNTMQILKSDLIFVVGTSL